MTEYLQGEEDDPDVTCCICAERILGGKDIGCWGMRRSTLQSIFICTDCAATKEEAETLHSVKFLL